MKNQRDGRGRFLPSHHPSHQGILWGWIALSTYRVLRTFAIAIWGIYVALGITILLISPSQGPTSTTFLEHREPLGYRLNCREKTQLAAACSICRIETISDPQGEPWQEVSR